MNSENTSNSKQNEEAQNNSPSHIQSNPPQTVDIDSLLSDDFLSQLLETKKINNKKKLLDKLLSTLTSITNLDQIIHDEKNYKRFEKLFNDSKQLLSENNNNFVISELNLLYLISKNIKNDKQFNNFIIDVLPKLFDKFNLQNQKINKSLVDLFNSFILSNGLKFNDFLPYIENVSVDDDDNYKMNILEFIYSQIKIDTNLNMKNISSTVDLLKKLSDENDNVEEVSNIALNCMEVLKIRSCDIDDMNKDSTSKNDISDAKTLNENDNKESILDADKVDKPENNEICNNEDQLRNNNCVEKCQGSDNNIESCSVKNSECVENKENTQECKENNLIMSEGNNNFNDIAPSIQEINSNNMQESNNSIQNTNKNNTLNAPIKKEDISNNNQGDSQQEQISKNEYSQNQTNNIPTDQTDNITSNSTYQKLPSENNIQNNENPTSGRNSLRRSFNTKLFGEKKSKGKIRNFRNLKSRVKKDDNENVPENQQVPLNNKLLNQNNDADISRFNDMELGPDKMNETIINDVNENISLNDTSTIINLNTINNINVKNININSNNLNNKLSNYMTYDDKPVGGNSLNNELFKEEIERLKKEEEECKEKESLNEVEDSKNKQLNEEGNNNKNVIVKEYKNAYDEIPVGGNKKFNFNMDEFDANSTPNQINISGTITKKDEQLKDENCIENKQTLQKVEEQPINTKTNTIKNVEAISKEQSAENQELIDQPSDQYTEGEQPQQKKIDFNKMVEDAERKEKELQSLKNKKLAPANKNKNIDDSENKNEDPQFDLIKSKLGSDITGKFESNEWNIKKEGFEKICTFIQIENSSLKSDKKLADDLVKYIKLKLKNFKETNINLIKEAFSNFNKLLEYKLLSKDNSLLILNAYCEKIIDIKLKDEISLYIKNIYLMSGNDIILTILSKISKKNNAKLLIEYSTLFGSLINENNVYELPQKEIIDFSKICVNNSNPNVRKAGIDLLCIFYKYIGDSLKKKLTDIKESTMKIIEDEFKKVEVINKNELDNENQGNLNNKEEDKGNDEENKEDENIDPELLPRVDISKKITSEMIKNLKSGKWKEKKETLESLEEILKKSKMKIANNGLNELFEVLKNKLTDPNKILVRMCVNLLSKFIESLGPLFKPYSKNFALVLIPNLADKMQNLRDDVQNCLDTWVNIISLDNIILYFPQFLKIDNYDIRNEIFKFLNKYKEKINRYTGENLFKELVDPFIICIQDKSSVIRNYSEEMIEFSIRFIGINCYYKHTKGLKPIIANDIEIILDKLKEKIDNANCGEEEACCEGEEEVINREDKGEERNKGKSKKRNNDLPNNELLNGNNNTMKEVEKDRKDHSKRNVKAKQSKNKNVDISNNDESYSPSKPNINLNNNNININNKSKRPAAVSASRKEIHLSKNINENNKNKKLEKQLSNGNLNINTNDPQSQAQIPNKSASNNRIPTKENEIRKSKVKTHNNANIKKIIPKGNNNSLNSIMSSHKIFLPNPNVKPNKEKRIESDKKFKFSIDTLPSEFKINRYRDQLRSLFTEDYLKKIQSDSISDTVDAVNRLKNSIEKNENINILLDNMDIILKLIVYKFLNQQTFVMLKCLFEFLDALLTLLISLKYELNDMEINLILPILVDKLSINNNTLKSNLIFLLNRYIDYIGATKAILIMLNYSLTKNHKIKCEILDLCGDLYLNGIIDIAPKPFIKVFCKFLSVNDNNIKRKVIGLFREIFYLIGEDLWNFVELNDKDMKLLEQNVYINENEEEEEAEGNEEEDGDNESRSDNGSNDYGERETKMDDNENAEENEAGDESLSDSSNISEENPPPPVKQNTKVINQSNQPQVGQQKKISVQQIKNNNTYIDRNSSKNKKGQNIKDVNGSIKCNGSENASNSNNNNIISTIGNLKTKEELDNIFNRLLLNDQTERINTIILIHELICPKFEENKSLLIENIDFIIITFISAMKTLFNNSDLKLEDIPIKFAKYLATVLCKICSNKELICNLSYDNLYSLSEELLTNLLIENLDKIGNNQEGSIIFKSLNSTMLRVLENCNGTNVIISLLEIIKKYRNNAADNKITVLAIKCLIKVNQNLSKITQTMDINKILKCIRYLLIDYEKVCPNYNPKNQTDQNIIKYIKTLIDEMVKIRGEDVMKAYCAIINSKNSPIISNSNILTDKIIISWIKSNEMKLNIKSTVSIGGDLNTSKTCIKGGSNYNTHNASSGKSGTGKDKIESKTNSNKMVTGMNVNSQRSSKVVYSREDMNSQISELKKKWNEVNRKGKK